MVCRITSSLSLQGVGLLPKALLTPSEQWERTKPDPTQQQGFPEGFPPLHSFSSFLLLNNAKDLIS